MMAVSNTATVTIEPTYKQVIDILLIESFSTSFLLGIWLVEKFSTKPSNTTPYSTTLPKKTILRKHLFKIFYGGDEKAFLVKS
ncbi:hypothetical protein DRP04_05995 [Archaeoglobales archaeon]|nr:MAG: hypothetical protein DRP04_05995 [Archaeoglobales archaeon]